MNEKGRVRVSKFLSRHLRHAPEDLGLALQPGGWVAVADLLAGCARAGLALTPAELREVVETNDKQRFSFDESGERIRANQGHTAEVDLQLEPHDPPVVLYHGTTTAAAPVILTEGLKRMARHHVHLSPDVPTALKVGARRGRPVVLAVEAGTMHGDGAVFYRAANGVWLVDEVPARYLRAL